MISLFRWSVAVFSAAALATLTLIPGPVVAAGSGDNLLSGYPESLERGSNNVTARRQHTSVVASPTALLLNQDFGLAFPPAGWTVTPANAPYSWIQGADTYGPLDGDARVGEDPAHAAQNEWLKTPTLSFVGSFGMILLNFHFKMSYDRSISPDNLQNLEVWISTNGGSSWPTKIWDETSVGVFPNYQWVGGQADLTSYIGKSTVKLAFRSVGTGGGPVDVDLVEVATFLCGDLNDDQVLSSADVIYLVNYVFKGGPPGNPPSEGDMNNNGLVNSSDIVFLVNHVFKGAGAPPCP